MNTQRTTTTLNVTRFASLLLALTLPGLFIVGCQSAKVTGERDLSGTPAAKPVSATIYVADFEVGVPIQHEQGMLAGQTGPVGRISDRLAGSSADPAARAKEIVNLMSTSLVKSLKQQGFSASRLLPGYPAPSDGWLVRGVFTEVQEGNRLQRALIGFGKGETDIQVIASIHDLSQGAPRPLYQLETDASSGSKPGAAPTIVLSPYGAAARFVMAGKDLDKNVKQTASQIADRIRQRFDAGTNP